MTDVDTSPPKTPAAIDAVPLRHPWRWAAAVVIVIVVGLFVYGAATNDAFRWHIFAKYVFNERVLKVGSGQHSAVDHLLDGAWRSCWA